MKKHVAFSLFSLLLLSSLSAEAYELPQQKDPAAQLLLQTLLECGKQKLGGEMGIDLAYAMGEQANRQIVAYCQQGNKKQAYETAVYYAGTDEGKAALECAAQLKPLVEQPAVQKFLGQYKAAVSEIVNGAVPQDVCVGVKRSSYNPYNY